MEYNGKIGFWARLCGDALFYGCKVVGWLPDWFLYGVLAKVNYFLLYHVLHYRRSVTRINLSRSFPQKSEAERLEIERKFYRHLAEVIVDTFSYVGISPKRIAKRVHYVDIDKFHDSLEGKSWICALGHYGSWEYFCAFPLFFHNYVMLGVYRPLHNKVIDYFYYNMRRRFGCTPTTMTGLMKSVVKHTRAGDSFEVGLLCDQTPPYYEIKHWFDFLNQPTPFFEGMERFAFKFHMPVYFAHLKKTATAHYELWFEELYDGKEELEEYELMQRYVSKLESMINDSPELWMWSHRRWKHKPGQKWQRRKSSY